MVLLLGSSTLTRILLVLVQIIFEQYSGGHASHSAARSLNLGEGFAIVVVFAAAAVAAVITVKELTMTHDAAAAASDHAVVWHLTLSRCMLLYSKRLLVLDSLSGVTASRKYLPKT